MQLFVFALLLYVTAEHFPAASQDFKQSSGDAADFVCFLLYVCLNTWASGKSPHLRATFFHNGFARLIDHATRRSPSQFLK